MPLKSFMPDNHWFAADWPAPTNVHTLISTRQGGISPTPWDSWNLSAKTSDNPQNIAQNRAILRQYLPADPVWLYQVHGTTVIDADHPPSDLPEADASISRSFNTVCVVNTADCLPVLMCNQAGTIVGAAHAGWKGLCHGVLENLVLAFNEEPTHLLAWFGPAIGPQAFEVRDDVRDAFLAHSAEAETAFHPVGSGHYLADIYALARQRLKACGVTQIYGGDLCTVTMKEHFFSYRRDHKKTGGMASTIWLSESIR